VCEDTMESLERNVCNGWDAGTMESLERNVCNGWDAGTMESLELLNVASNKLEHFPHTGAQAGRHCSSDHYLSAYTAYLIKVGSTFRTIASPLIETYL